MGWRILDLNGVLNRSPKLNELIGFVRQQFQAELFRVHVGVERPAVGEVVLHRPAARHLDLLIESAHEGGDVDERDLFYEALPHLRPSFHKTGRCVDPDH